MLLNAALPGMVVSRRLFKLNVAQPWEFFEPMERMMADEFDLVVIGAGPAGEKAAMTAAILGKRVAVVEKAAAVGGAAVNTGTVPSKTLRETALALSGLRSRELYGVDLSLRRNATIDDFLRHERAVKLAERQQIHARLLHQNVEIINGFGSFADPHTVAVKCDDGERAIRGRKIAIAIGSKPVRPEGIPFEHPCVHDSDQLLDLHALPKSIGIVGAGVIGSEYACMFDVLGVRVVLIDGRDRLMPFLDADIAAALTDAMCNSGITIIWNERVVRCDVPETGHVRLTLGSGKQVPVEQVLICAGRMSRTAEINPEAAGLVLCNKGRLQVNEHYQTNVPHIYAIGDVIGFPALASTSAEQGRLAACHMFDFAYPSREQPVLPSGIYTIPEVSCAGKTEEELIRDGTPYVVGRAGYGQTPRGKIIGDKIGFLKLLAHRESHEILGVHVIGELATEIVHTGVLALMTHQNLELMIQTCFNYPTLGELYKLAAYDALKKVVLTS